MADTVFDGDYVTLIAGEAITQFALVTYETDGYVDETDGTADADANVIGVAMNAAAAQGDAVSVRLLNRGGIVPVIADVNSITLGEALYTAANGEVTDSNLSGTQVGYAMEASDTALDVIQMMVAVGQAYNVT